MKKRFHLICLILFTAILSQAQEVNFQVDILQNQQSVPRVNDSYHLKKGTIDFLFKVQHLEGFLLGVTLDEDVYEAALGRNDLEVSWFENTGMAEAYFNESKKLFISNDAPSYWYFTDENDHRFNLGAQGTAEDWVGIRTIRLLDDLLGQKSISLDRFKGNLYIIMYTPIYDKDYRLKDKKILFHASLKF